VLKVFGRLVKFGIVSFVILSGLAGYTLALRPDASIDWGQLLSLVFALFFLSAGSFAVNQAQEHKIDRLMQRTALRPIATGEVSLVQAWTIGLLFIFVGLAFALLCSWRTAAVGLATVVLYNGFYTLWWKRSWSFGAVPGAIPGALPVVMGYSALSTDLLRSELIYAFLIMFLWQMPHFWVLAIRYRHDYAQGSVPVLPASAGVESTLFQMGLYTFAYVALAVSSPWFTTTYWAYIFAVVPFALKVLYEFFQYFKSREQERWLPFFLWMNFSVLIFLVAPVIDKWHRFALGFID
jgi:protoheme IX farnesyltransferase